MSSQRQLADTRSVVIWIKNHNYLLCAIGFFREANKIWLDMYVCEIQDDPKTGIRLLISWALCVHYHVFYNIQTTHRRFERLVPNCAWCTDHARVNIYIYIALIDSAPRDFQRSNVILHSFIFMHSQYLHDITNYDQLFCVNKWNKQWWASI